MPIVCTFYGIIVRRFYDNHSPPHFHAEYGEFKATIGIQTLEVIDGKLPRRALNLTLDWAELHRADLMADWELCRQHQPPRPLEPLL